MTNVKEKRKINPVVVRRYAQSGAVKVVRTLFLLGLCYLFLFPVFYLMLAAFSDAESLKNPNVVWIPLKWTFENVVSAIAKLDFWPAAGLSAIHAVFGTAASLASCSLVGYGLARYKFAEKGIVFMAVILTIIVPPQILLITQYLQYLNFLGTGISLLNTPWVLILPAIFGAGLKNGLFIFIFRQFFLGMPKDLEEAAWVDGCNPLMTFIRIIVPSSGPGIITVTLFSFVWHWNDYYYSGMLYNKDLKPLIPKMQLIKSDLETAVLNGGVGGKALSSRGVLAAAGIMTIIVPLVLYLFLQRHFVESIERTGIVG